MFAFPPKIPHNITMSYQEYQAKKILNVYKNVDGGWFWVKYSAHPYIGCVHGCEYCYEWGTKYSGFRNADEFTETIKVKTNASELLRNELKKVPRELVAIGDWQGAEAKYRLSRKMLEVCLEEEFPVFINEKSDLVLEDLELIKKINDASFANVGFSIITAPSYAAYKQIRFFESNAPDIERRFKAMEEFSRAGILTGTMLMPILPFIFDSEENIEAVIRTTKEVGGKYVLAGSLTLEGAQKDRYYNLLRKNFPDVLNKYISLYRGKFAPQKSYMIEVMNMVKKYCKRYDIAMRIPRYTVPGKFQNNKIVAEKLYNKAVEIDNFSTSEIKAYAYRKAASTIDNLEYDILIVFESMKQEGLEKIPHVSKKIAQEIADIIELERSQQE